MAWRRKLCVTEYLRSIILSTPNILCAVRLTGDSDFAVTLARNIAVILARTVGNKIIIYHTINKIELANICPSCFTFDNDFVMQAGTS